MKKVLFVFLFLPVLISSQLNLNSYKYITIENITYKNSLRKKIVDILQNSGYNVVNLKKPNITFIETPEDLRNDPKLSVYLAGTVIQDGGAYETVTLNLYDADNNLLWSNSSQQITLNSALISAISPFVNFRYKYNPSANKSITSKNKSNNSKWKGNGSGIIISKDGYLVTNNHVVDKMSDFEVEFKYNQEITSFKAKLIKADVTNDLAILKIDDEEFTDFKSIPYNFKSRSVDVGTEVYALGYPMALTIMGKDIKFTDGRVSSKTGFQGDITTYQTTTPIQPGNSGGPLFDHNANFLGINSSGIRKDIADNVSYTIKTNYVVNLIDVLPKSIPIPSNTTISSKPLTEQIKILSNYVVLVKVR